jgi:hypothetical protein
VGILGNRVIARANIQAEKFAVTTVVTGKSISYTIRPTEQPQRNDFGPFREIIVEGYYAKCSASFFSPYHAVRLNYNTIKEISDAVSTGDFIRSYLVVLDELLSGVSMELALNPYSDNKSEMEEHLSIIGKIRSDIMDSKIIEDPIMVLKRLQNTVLNR